MSGKFSWDLNVLYTHPFGFTKTDFNYEIHAMNEQLRLNLSEVAWTQTNWAKPIVKSTTLSTKGKMCAHLTSVSMRSGAR